VNSLTSGTAVKVWAESHRTTKWRRSKVHYDNEKKLEVAEHVKLNVLVAWAEEELELF
jgi:hypothetical protein